MQSSVLLDNEDLYGMDFWEIGVIMLKAAYSRRLGSFEDDAELRRIVMRE